MIQNQFSSKVLLTLVFLMVPTPGFSMGRSLLDQIALYPSTDRIETNSAERKLLPSGLEIWIHRRSAQSPSSLNRKVYLLHFIGNASRAEEEGPESALLNLFPPNFNVESWAVNYRGFGGSTGEARVNTLAETGRETFAALSLEAGNAPIIISGFSMGTTVALYLAANRAATGVILRNPVPLREMILGRYGWWNLWIGAGPISLQIPKELDSIKNATLSHLPALILSSENDSAVPRKYQNKIIQKYAGPLDQVVLKNF
jgi:pimeloyl-ACP methyl ester carboxylesterase